MGEKTRYSDAELEEFKVIILEKLAKAQKEYDEFREDILTLFLEPQVNEVFINAKIGEESEYDNPNISTPLIIRKIEEYDVDEIID